MISRALTALVLVHVGIVIGWWCQLFSQLSPALAQIPLDQPFASTVSPTFVAPSSRPATTEIPWPEYSPEELINMNVYEACNRGVVNISTTLVRPTSFFTETAFEGSGSGAIIDRQGHLTTNYHVIEGARDINVTLYTGDSYPAILVGADPDNDIAVLKISAPEEQLFPIPIGESSSLRVGQHIIAIGNPFGYERTMSTGIISSLNRLITSKTKRKIRSIITEGIPDGDNMLPNPQRRGLADRDRKELLLRGGDFQDRNIVIRISSHQNGWVGIAGV